jgi:enoyl-CoA hydratase/carnithine racemase
MSYELVADLDQVLRRIEEDRAVRAVTLTGAGRGFCSGYRGSRRPRRSAGQIEEAVKVRAVAALAASVARPERKESGRATTMVSSWSLGSGSDA